mgnify:CR=1 FL=1
MQVTAVDPRSYSTCQVSGTLVADHQTVGGIRTVAVKQDLKKSGIRLAAALVRGDKDTVEQIPESQRAQLVFGEDPLGIGQEVDPTAFCMELLQCAEGVLERVYPTRTPASGGVKAISWEGRSPAVCAHKTARPKAVIPVFPGTNCEYDTAAACLRAGIEPEIVVVKNLSAGLLAQSAQALEQAIQGAQMIVLPGGFSGGDEPDGSAKFICSFFRNPRLTDAVHDLLKNRDGLMLGICNGFQALVKLGLVPYGEIRPMHEDCATLTFNDIGRHQSRYVTTRVASVNSPWMLRSQVGDLHAIPVSHGEGKFVAPGALLEELITRGQVATQYVDLGGAPSMDIAANPNGSVLAIEGIFSPDGRVFGKMGHSERRGTYIAKNIPGDKYQPIFESGAAYFQ